MRTCYNCEKRDVCMSYKTSLYEYEACDNWQGWIKCEDELPRDTEDCLVAYNDFGDIDFCVAYLSRTGLWKTVESEYAFNDGDVRAWRPLPEYKEAEDERM